MLVAYFRSFKLPIRLTVCSSFLYFSLARFILYFLFILETIYYTIYYILGAYAKYATSSSANAMLANVSCALAASDLAADENFAVLRDTDLTYEVGWCTVMPCSLLLPPLGSSPFSIAKIGSFDWNAPYVPPFLQNRFDDCIHIDARYSMKYYLLTVILRRAVHRNQSTVAETTMTLMISCATFNNRDLTQNGSNCRICTCILENRPAR